MLNITTVHLANASGRAQVKATGHGKQRTVSLDHSKSPEANAGAAVGALLAAIATDVQRAKVLHPSGGQRVRHTWDSPFGGKMRWTIDV